MLKERKESGSLTDRLKELSDFLKIHANIIIGKVFSPKEIEAENASLVEFQDFDDKPETPPSDKQE